MDMSDVRRFFLESGVLPPTLATQLAKNLDTLPTTQVALLITLIDQAKTADAAFGKSSSAYLTAVKNLEVSTLARVEDAEAAILAEFEKELISS